MCGIGAIISAKEFSLRLLLTIPFHQLERGVHGTGIAWSDGKSIYVLKDPIHPSEFASKYTLFLKKVTTHMAIVHHRAPSQGTVAYRNTHPFLSCELSPIKMALVHNGHWWENHWYRGALESRGHKFEGETDSEVLLHYIEEMLLEGGQHNDLYDVMRRLVSETRFGAILVLTTDSVYCARTHNPLHFVVGEYTVVLASTVEACKAVLTALGERTLHEGEIKVGRIWLREGRVSLKGLVRRWRK